VRDDSPKQMMKVLVVDVGGTHVKLLVSGQDLPRRVDSGPTMTAEQMVSQVAQVAVGWSYDAISIGYPGPVIRGRIVADPHNMGPGWIGFDFERAFSRPVKLINDAAMQALGSYDKGKMLFVGLGTGLGSALIAEGVVVPLELAHMPYRKGTFEDYVGLRGLKRMGRRKWRNHVAAVIDQFVAAFQPDEIVLGGGNLKELKELPPLCRPGSNANAFEGGFRLWEESRAANLDEHRFRV
jgi:polyphosphate glucokinase